MVCSSSVISNWSLTYLQRELFFINITRFFFEKMEHERRGNSRRIRGKVCRLVSPFSSPRSKQKMKSALPPAKSRRCREIGTEHNERWSPAARAWHLFQVGERSHLNISPIPPFWINLRPTGATFFLPWPCLALRTKTSWLRELPSSVSSLSFSLAINVKRIHTLLLSKLWLYKEGYHL